MLWGWGEGGRHGWFSALGMLMSPGTFYVGLLRVKRRGRAGMCGRFVLGASRFEDKLLVLFLMRGGEIGSFPGTSRS